MQNCNISNCQPSYNRKKLFLFLSMHVIRTFILTINAANPETTPSSWNRYVKTQNTSERDSVIVTTQEEQAESLEYRDSGVYKVNIIQFIKWVGKIVV